MRETPRSALGGKICQMEGFQFGKHPEKKNFFLEVSVYTYRSDGRRFCVLCVSEGPQFDQDVLSAQLGLGKPVKGEAIMPFAARFTDMPLSDFRKHLEETLTDGKWYWYEHKDQS